MKKAFVASMVIFVFVSVAEADTSRERSIAFKSEDGTSLGGTLTLPELKTSRAKVPAVLLLGGSGPTDRDGNQPPHLVTDILRQIAHGLASQGIASLRFDKRAAHTNKMQWPAKEESLAKFFSFDNHLADVRSAFKVMRDSKEIEPKRLAILGHSEGGLLALAQANKLSPKSLILVGTPGRSLGDVLVSQIGALLDKQGASFETKADYLKKMIVIHDYLAEKGEIPPNVPAGLAALYPPSAKLFLKDVIKLDPNSFAKNYRGSVLIMNGEFDVQVSPTLDAKVLAAAFETRGLKTQKLEIIPAASHNLKKVGGPADLGISGAVDANAMSILSSWISKNL